MPVDIDTFADDEIKMRWREPFLTAGLNEKQAVNRPAGVYRGFRLSPGVGANVVSIDPDPTFDDHAAVYETTTGFSLALRKTGGPFTIDLTGLVDGVDDKTWVLCLFTDYAVGAATAAAIRAYELDPTDEFTVAPEYGELVVLGTVFIEANNADAFTTNEINYNYRSMAWLRESSETAMWQPLVRNGGFEIAFAGAPDTSERIFAYWKTTTNSANGKWVVDFSDARSAHVALAWERFGAGSISGNCVQKIGASVVPGQLLKYQVYKKSLQATPTGTIRLFLNWATADGAVSGSAQITLPATAIDADYVLVEGVIEVPAARYFLESVDFVAVSFTPPSDGLALLIDDLQIWAEPLTLDTALQNDIRGTSIPDMAARSLVLFPGLDELTDTAHAVVALEPTGTSAGQDSTGGLKVVGTTGEAVSILQPPPVSGAAYTLIHEANAPSVAIPGVRMYMSATGEMLRTVNAKYSNDSSNWSKDHTSEPAYRVIYAAGGIRFESQHAFSSWTDANWFSPYGGDSAFIVDPMGNPSRLHNRWRDDFGVDMGWADGRLYSADASSGGSIGNLIGGLGAALTANSGAASNRGEVQLREVAPINCLGGFTVRMKWGYDNTEPMTNRVDWVGWTFLSDLANVKMVLIRDTAVGTNLRLRWLDGASAAQTLSLGFTPVVDTWYVMTLAVLSQDPGVVMLRIGTTAEWLPSDPVVSYLNLSAYGDGAIINRGTNWDGHVGCKTLDAVQKQLLVNWIEFFTTTDYDPALGLGD